MYEVEKSETLCMKCCNDLTVIPLIIRGHVVTKQMGQNQISFPLTQTYNPKRNVRAHWRRWVEQRARRSRTHTTFESVRVHTALECRTERAATARKQEMQESPLSPVSVTTGFRLEVRLTQTHRLLN